MSIKDKLLARIRGKGRGHIYVAANFYDLANRDTVDQTLSRLCCQNVLTKLDRGIYLFPQRHPILGDLLPSTDDIAIYIARIKRSQLQISGAHATHKLGLTQQVPMQIVYLTDNFTRTINIGKLQIVFKKASIKTPLLGINSKAGSIIQAIKFLGKKNINPDVIKIIKKQITNNDISDLKKHLARIPIWMQTYIKMLAA